MLIICLLAIFMLLFLSNQSFSYPWCLDSDRQLKKVFLELCSTSCVILNGREVRGRMVMLDLLFLGSCLIATKIWSNGLNGVKQLTSYSLVQLKQTDLLLHNQWRESRPAPKESSSFFLLIPLAFLLSYFQPPPFGYSLCKVALVLTSNQWKGMQMGIRYITVDYAVYVFPWFSLF